MSDEDAVIEAIEQARKHFVHVMDMAGKSGYAIKIGVAEAYTTLGPHVPKGFSDSFGIAIYKPIGALG